MLVSALTLGFGAIGSNLIFTSLVCFEIAAALEEFKEGVGDNQVKVQSIQEVISSIKDHKDLEYINVEGDALRKRRRRILEKITSKPIEATTQLPTACDCPCSPKSINCLDKELAQKENQTEICECTIPVGELIPTAGNPKGAVRRYPMRKITIPLRDGAAKESPAPSQIAIESVGTDVMLAPRRILYNFNQNGRVNITHVRESGKYTTVIMPFTDYPLTERTTVPIPRYQYKYIGGSTGQPKSTFYPTSLSKLFIRRLRKMLGEKSHVVDKAYAIERDILQSAQEMVLIDRLARKRPAGGYSSPAERYNPLNGRIERIQDIWRHSPFRRRNQKLTPL